MKIGISLNTNNYETIRKSPSDENKVNLNTIKSQRILDIVNKSNLPTSNKENSIFSQHLQDIENIIANSNLLDNHGSPEIAQEWGYIGRQEKYIFNSVNHNRNYFSPGKEYFFNNTIVNEKLFFSYTSPIRETLNDYSNSAYLKTDFGEVNVFLDINGDKKNPDYILKNFQLFNFDSNKDGLLNSDDKFFDKLKVKGYDKDGNEKIAKLSDVVSQVDLEKFIRNDYKEILKTNKISYNGAREAFAKTFEPHRYHFVDNRDINIISNPYNLFIKAEYRYKKIEDKDIEKFFESYANEDGWVDLRANNDIFDKFNNFAYIKQGLEKNDLRLSEFNSIKAKDDLNIGENAYIKHQKDNFLRFYNEYQEAKKDHLKLIDEIKNSKYQTDQMRALVNNADLGSATMIAMQNDFTKNTGLDFSEENLEKLKSMFKSDAKKAAYAMDDGDSVVAMKLNKNGSITLKFDSGREIRVSELYNDTGKLNTINGKRVSVNLKAKTMNDEELNKLDFNKVGIIIDKDGKDDLVSLKELGVKAIEGYGIKGFILALNNNDRISTKDLFNIMFLDNKINKKSMEVKEEDRFYRKIDVRV